MAQTSYTIANGSGAVVRARFNEVTAAVQSSNSGGTAPTETVAGMLWFDTSVSPAVMRQRNAANTEWMVPELRAANNLSDLANEGTARTNLGATTTGAALFTAADAAAGRTALGATTIGSAIFTASDAAAAREAIGGNELPPPFDSGELTITAAGGHTLPHGLGVRPKLRDVVFVCKTAEFGFAVGDEVDATLIDSTRSLQAIFAIGLAAAWTTTQVKIRFGSFSGIPLLDLDTGENALGTPANWRLIVRAWA